MAMSFDAGADAAGYPYNRPACTECQRRKQRCDREWPCDRCQRRKIADECRYANTCYSAPGPGPNPPPAAASHHVDDGSRDRPSREPAVATPAPASCCAAGASSPADGPGFDALAAARLFTTLGIASQPQPAKTASRQDFAAADSSPQLEHVLQLMPLRQSMDKLINIFAHNVNYHYYIIYPPDFLREYHIWWERRAKGRPITLQYTCLVAMVCACCVQHVDLDMQQELQHASGLDAEALSEQLHCAVRELASLIPVGHYHMFNVQRLLQSCYWYKAEAKFVEAWHVLSAAILEARELGYHREPPVGTETAYECEIRRRLWCILDTWDWQISSGLSRPKIIDRVDCDAELPSLTLEDFPAHAPSPLLHMKMQSELTRQLASRFSAPKNIVKPREVQEYKALIEAWVRRFPPVYHFDDPDTSLDARYPWVFPHRYYFYTMACLLILNPIRHYMVRSYTRRSPPEELSIRAVGVSYSLKLMRTLRSWVDGIYDRDGRLHFIFSIFDTAAILCTAIIKDYEHTITEHDEILDAVGDAVNMLERLNSISKVARTSYDLLERLVRRLPPPVTPRRQNQPHKKARVSGVPVPVPDAAMAPEPGPEPAHMSGAASTTAAASSAMAYNKRFDIRPVPRPVPHSGYAPTGGLSRVPTPLASSVNNQSSGTYSNYSTCSESTPRSMDDHTVLSFDHAGDGSGPVNGPAQPVTDCAYLAPPVAYRDGPEFELETVTQAQLGELAPLWSWHSENLDFANMSSVVAGPGYPQPSM